MDVADRLVKKIFSWVELQQECADKLHKLANEMEETQKNVNVTKVVGSSVSVAGAAAMAGAGVATLLTGGAALPFIAMAGGAATWIGLATNATSDAVNIIASKQTLEEAEEVSEKIQSLHSEMKKLIELLNNEAQKRQEQDDSHCDVIEFILRGMARRKGLDLDDSVSLSKTISIQFGDRITVEDGLRHTLQSIGFYLIMKPAVKAAGGLAEKVAILTAGKTAGIAAGKAAGKAVGRMAGGALGLAIAVPELIYNCKNLDVSETEASKRLKKNSKAIRAESKKMKEELEKTEKILEEMVQCQQRDKQRKIQQEHERKKTFLFKITFSGFRVTDRSRKTESESDQRYEEEGSSPRYRRGEEEQGRKQTAQTGGGQQGGRDDEDKERRDDEDEERDRESEESDSEEKEDEENTDEANRNQTNCLDLNIACVNFRSIKNKIRKLLALLRRNSLHILIIAEAWLNRNTADEFLRRVLPENFSFRYFAREGRGGGVAIIYLNEFEGILINLTSTRTFEHVAVELQHTEWRQPVLFTAVYHRTERNLNTFAEFRAEFEGLLNAAFRRYSSILLAGDFNIHVDNERREATRLFNILLEECGLVQHVNQPTHRAGHTLDLVISRNFNISDLTVRNNNISDHFTIYFKGKPASEGETKEDEEDERIKRHKKRQ